MGFKKLFFIERSFETVSRTGIKPVRVETKIRVLRPWAATLLRK